MLLGCVGLSKNSHQGRQNRFQVCVAHRLNRNNSVLQDACSVKLPFLSTDSCFFCLCEGHRNGLEVSQTVSSLLHEFLLKEIQARHSSFGMKSCFENAYKRMDEYLGDTARDRGTTVAAIMIRRHANSMRIYVSNVGRPQAILCRASNAIRITKQHTQTEDEEHCRLAACPAYTQTSPRIRQLVLSSRALGDHLFKDWVISTPHYAEFELNQHDSDVVVMTSNICEVLSDEEVLQIVRGFPIPPVSFFFWFLYQDF